MSFRLYFQQVVIRRVQEEEHVYIQLSVFFHACRAYLYKVLSHWTQKGNRAVLSVGV